VKILRSGPRKFPGTAGKLLLPTPKIHPIQTNFHPDFAPGTPTGGDALNSITDVIHFSCFKAKTSEALGANFCNDSPIHQDRIIQLPTGPDKNPSAHS
jgi:hypothetical protein